MNFFKKSSFSVNSFTDFEKGTQLYAEFFFHKEQLVQQMDQEILSIKEKFQKKISSTDSLLKNIEHSLFEYMKINKKSIFKNSKSLSLPFAKIGFRKSSEIILPENLDQLIAELKNQNKYSCISVSESVKKSSLGEFSEQELLALNISKSSQEKPFITPILSSK